MGYAVAMIWLLGSFFCFITGQSEVGWVMLVVGFLWLSIGFMEDNL